MRVVGGSASRARIGKIAATMAALCFVLWLDAPALGQSASGPPAASSAASTSADKTAETATAPPAGSAASGAMKGAPAEGSAPAGSSEAAAGGDLGKNAAAAPEGAYRAQDTQSLPPTTTEIPQAAPTQQSVHNGSSDANGQIVNYEATQDPQLIEPQLHSLQEFIAEGENASPLGLELREAQRQLKDGEKADGLLIVNVVPNSPAAKAGLRSYRRTAHDLLEGTAVAAALVFPPAVIAVPLIDGLSVGETYDMIIAVDGTRITNFLDFEDQMRDVRPGEVVYLTVVRDGARKQVPVDIPSTLSATVY